MSHCKDAEANGGAPLHCECVDDVERMRAQRDAALNENAVHAAFHDVAVAQRNAAWAELSMLRLDLERLQDAKNGAYAERNKLVALVSKVFPSCLGRHEDTDTSWEDDWRWIVYVTLPTGQCSWHIHDSDLPLFSHLKKGDVQWDGHTTAEKYARIAAYRTL